MSSIFYVYIVYIHTLRIYVCHNPRVSTPNDRAAMAPASLGQFEEETCLRSAGEADASQTQGDRAIGPCDTVCMTHGAYTV